MKTPAESRRTFAIISHPDAGKTTLTEKLLLFGGAIHLAGAVKAKKGGQSAHSDWMAIEQQRGISVTASVMTFEYQDHTVNLLDTPGHKDFSEDTYRTLTAVDSAVMVLDAAKGIEEQTRKLFEVCRLRDMPILTFINKMDREARDPFELLDDIEKTLALDVCPITWPIGMGERFKGCFDIVHDQLYLFEAGKGTIPPPPAGGGKGAASQAQEAAPPPPQPSPGSGIHPWDAGPTNKMHSTPQAGAVRGGGVLLNGIHDPRLDELIPAAELAQFREEVEMVRGMCKPFDRQAYLEGHLTPVFFGSAINNFGVRELLNALCEFAPSPRPQKAEQREITPEESKFTGFVFKVQANMDKNHRDRIAFVRICSGQYTRGMKVLHGRTGKTLSLNNPVLFLARERELADNAFPGDIIGIPGHGNLRIGDTLSEGENLHFTGIPSFAPEHFQRVRLDDPMRSKQLKTALEQLAEEGASQVFKPLNGSAWIIGVVGLLQFDVLASRLIAEYNVKGGFEAVSYATARWVNAANPELLKQFAEKNLHNMAEDSTGALAYLAPNDWHLTRIQQDWPEVKFSKTRENR